MGVAAASGTLAAPCPPSLAVPRSLSALKTLGAPPPICSRLAERLRARGYAQRVQQQWKRELIANDRELLEEEEEGEEEELEGGESEAEDEVPRFRILQVRSWVDWVGSRCCKCQRACEAWP